MIFNLAKTWIKRIKINFNQLFDSIFKGEIPLFYINFNFKCYLRHQEVLINSAANNLRR